MSEFRNSNSWSLRLKTKMEGGAIFQTSETKFILYLMICVSQTTKQLALVATHAPLVSSCHKSGVRIPLAPDFLILLFFKDLQLVLKYDQLKASHEHQARVGAVVLF